MQHGLSFYFPCGLNYYFGCYTYNQCKLNGSVSYPEYLYPYVWLCKPSLSFLKFNIINFLKTVILNKLAREKFPSEIFPKKYLHWSCNKVYRIVNEPCYSQSITRCSYFHSDINKNLKLIYTKELLLYRWDLKW